MACLEAVIATVLAWVLLGEHLDVPQIIGGAVVLVGAFIAQSSTPKAPAAGPVAGSATDDAGEAGLVGTSGEPGRDTELSARRTAP